VLLAADGVSNNESIGQNRIAMTARWVAKSRFGRGSTAEAGRVNRQVEAPPPIREARALPRSRTP